MSPALIRKTVRDYLLLWLAAMVLLLGFVVLYILASHSVSMNQGREFLRLEWVRRLFSALVGSDVMDAMTPTGVSSFAFTHPLVWTLIVAFVLTITSGVLAGEMDRGTMDLVATRPISRPRMYMSLSVVVLAMGLPICWVLWVGAWLGKGLAQAEQVDMAALAMLPWHLYAAYVFLACLALAISGVCDRRTEAATLAFLYIFYSFVLNLLGAFWAPVKKIAFTGFLQYYAVIPIVRDQVWRTGDMAVLLAAGAVCWAAGLIAFCRRDIPAR